MKEKNIYEGICGITGHAYAYIYDVLYRLPRFNNYQYCRPVQNIYEMSLFNAELASYLQKLVTIDARLINMFKLHKYKETVMMPGMIIDDAVYMKLKSDIIFVTVKNGDCYALYKYMLSESLKGSCIAVSRSKEGAEKAYTATQVRESDNKIRMHMDALNRLGISADMQQHMIYCVR